jgi:hypothetical protein
MKTLLAVLQLTLVSQVPAQGSEKPVSGPLPESKRVTVIDFEDTVIETDLTTPSEMGCFPDRREGFHHRLIRLREDFDEKVMQSVAEM